VLNKEALALKEKEVIIRGEGLEIPRAPVVKANKVAAAKDFIFDENIKKRY
jgi:hypothetical protein